MLGPRDIAFPLDFPWVAQINEDCILVVKQRRRFVGRNRLDFGIRLIEHFAKPFSHF
jgi:hypothetical protein